MAHSSAQSYLRSKLKGADGASESRKDSMLIAMGLLAVAEGLESISGALDDLRREGGDGVAQALATGLGDMEVATTKLAESVDGLGSR